MEDRYPIDSCEIEIGFIIFEQKQKYIIWFCFVGVNNMVNNGSYTAAFSLHDVSIVALLSAVVQRIVISSSTEYCLTAD